MKQLSKLSLKHLCVCIPLLCALLCNCKTIDNEQKNDKPKSYFIVKKVKKLKHGVYIIYANRNDSIYKIVSYYDGKSGNKENKLIRGMHFLVSIESVFHDFDKKNNIIPPCNTFMVFHGIAITKEPAHGINDVWFCKELNGPYLTK